MRARTIVLAGFLTVPYLPGLAVLVGALPVAAAESDLPVPTRPPGETLRIPGLPPIELPPGAKVFGPHGPELGNAPPSTKPPGRGEAPAIGGLPGTGRELRGSPTSPTPAGKASKAPAEPGRMQVLDALFKQLHDAREPDAAKGVAAAIQRVWDRSGSDTADLLTNRAMAAVGAGKPEIALDLLDRVVELMPDWAEGWNKRATVRYLQDDYDGAMADIDSTLALEPRHFGSLGGLATILGHAGLKRRALEVMRRSVELYPQQPDLQKMIDRLAPDVDGRDI